MRKKNYINQNMARKTEKREKCEIHKQDMGIGKKQPVKRGK